MKVAAEHIFSGVTKSLDLSYDSDKLMIGSLIKQYTGLTANDKYISPRSSAIVNNGETANTSYHMPHVYQWSNNIYWVFVAQNATAAVTRTIGLYEFNSETSSLTWKGFITLSGTTIIGAKTIRSLRGYVYKHNTGTVVTSGSSITINGSGTGFVTERIAVGARIGFGSTDPTQITSWYEITAISNDTTLTINAPVNITSSTPYVIEEIRVAVAVTNATLINGGVHLIKGLNYGTFNPGGTIIPEATTVDNIRASYLLTDNATTGSATATISYSTTNILSCNNHGFAVGDVIYFTTTATLPTGLTANTAYYIISTNFTANQFSVSASYGGAIAPISAAGSGTHTVHSGSSKLIATIAADDMISNTNHPMYIVNATSSALAASITRYNIRADLITGSLTGGPASGTSNSAFVFKTTPLSITGTISQNNCGRIFTVNHGVAGGIKSVFFVTTTRIYRCSVSDISSGSVSWISDFMFEIPPGTSTTHPVTSNMVQIDYSSTIDRIIVTTGSTRFACYTGKYDPSNTLPMERIFGAPFGRSKLSTSAINAPNGLFPSAGLTVWTESGWMFAIPSIVTSGLNWLFIFPMAVDSYYASSCAQYVITPKISTNNAIKFYRAYLKTSEYQGSNGLELASESFNTYYRTSGIDDNTGAWTILSDSGDLTGASPGNYIQFKFEFSILNGTCIPAKIYSLCVVYEDASQDSHYEPSVTKSSVSDSRFAWQQVSSWGTSVPNLRIRIYNADTNFLVLEDTTNEPNSGVWERSTGPSSWGSWDSTADTLGNYIRYTANTLPNNITVRVLLTQASL